MEFINGGPSVKDYNIMDKIRGGGHQDYTFFLSISVINKRMVARTKGVNQCPEITKTAEEDSSNSIENGQK